MRVLGVIGGAYLFWKFLDIVSVGVPAGVPGKVPETYGTVGAIGDLLFRDFLYPFESISLLLLIAIVGGVVVSRSHRKEVAAVRAADYRHQFHELAQHDFPGQGGGGDAPTSSGGHH
jgi:hypothetical protein